MGDAKTSEKKNQVAAVLVVVAVTAVYFFYPVFGSYKLKPGYVACPTKDAITEHRGARLIYGSIGAAVVAFKNKCINDKSKIKIIYRSTMFDLQHRISINGRTMYADHDALEEF
ncbi:MAG: hypothetical protein IPN53_25175 [Comamonadaceae bacterium]|nr:hypothetical protein [Comamonadaceae bacterium]